MATEPVPRVFVRAASGVVPRAFAVALAGGASLVALGLADGGVYPRAWRLATVAFCALAAAALLVRARIALDRLEWTVVAAFAGLAGWTALSATWSGGSAGSILAAERTATYLALMLAFLLLCGRDDVPYLLAGLVAGITLVSAFGLGEYLVSPPPLDPFEGRLLHRPLGYANALGIYAAIGAVVAVGLALATRRAIARAAALVPLVVLVPTLLLTSSRGAVLCGAIGLLVLVRPRRAMQPRVVAALAVVAVAAVVAVVGVLGASGGKRGDYWRVALEDARAHPVLGDGAGTYGDYWLAHGPGGSYTRTAHSLYLQSLAELGPAGLVLVLAALGLPLVRVRSGRDPVAAAAAAGYVAYVVHTGIDWDWEMPATTVAGLLCGVALLAGTRGRRATPLGVPARAALAVLVLALGVAAAVRLGAGPASPFAS